MTCEHNSFAAHVDVHRLSHVDGGPITGYSAEIHIKCVECGLPFRFLGLPFGSHHAEPRLSADSTELRAPIEPAYAPELLGHPIVSGRA